MQSIRWLVKYTEQRITLSREGSSLFPTPFLFRFIDAKIPYANSFRNFSKVAISAASFVQTVTRNSLHRGLSQFWETAI